MNEAARLAASVATVVAVAVPLHLVGAGGWRFGLAVVTVPIVAAGAAVAHRLFRDSPGRGMWTAAVVVLAIVAGARVSEAAPPSAGTLSATLDRLPLAFYEQVSEEGSGSGWCSPTCPVVRRRYRGPVVSVDAAEREVAQAVRSLGAVRNTRIGFYVRLDRGRQAAATDDVLTLTITARARRG